MREYILYSAYFTTIKFLKMSKKEMGSVRPGQEALWQTKSVAQIWKPSNRYVSRLTCA